jgi:hypothetical protein
VAPLVEGLCYKPVGRGFGSRSWHWNFFLLTYFFRPHYVPWVDSNLYQKWVPGLMPVGEAGGAWGWQPCHLHMPIVLKSGSLNCWNPSGPVKACNGIALPLPLIYLSSSVLISSNLSVLSSKTVTSYIIVNHKTFFVLYLHILMFTDVCVCRYAVEYPCIASLSVTSIRLPTSWVENKNTRILLSFQTHTVSNPSFPLTLRLTN